MAKHKIEPVEADPQFIEQEEKLLDHWYKSGIVDKYLHKNDKSPQKFTFQDGPITANNPMGVHHGWGRTYKDLWQRYKNMRGYAQRFQNGFDCQGLWVEVEVEKELGFRSKKDIEMYGIAKFVQKCKDRVKKYSDIQTEQSKRLGYFMDWENSYFTMSDENNYSIWNFLKVCHQNGWLYKGKDSVPWCPRCQTAISQHEMLTEDYKDVVHKSIYFKLPLINTKNEHLLVWTTTPWTIPANIAVAVDKKLDYSLIEDENKNKYWLAKNAVKRIFKDKKTKTLKTVKGTELVGAKYKGAFDDLPAAKLVAENNQKFHTVIPTDPMIMPITPEEGTGLVHTAVSAGSEDFKLGKQLGLPIIPVIEDDASYMEGLGWLTGKNAKKHPELILDHMQKTDFVFLIENYKHRYPACWRCKKELVWKVTDEYYIAMDKGKPTLRERMKRVTKKIRWIPEFGLKRELDWLNNMHDWLISKKNRYWGLCLPIWECDKCNHIEVIGSKKELKEKAVKGWDKFKGKSPHKPQIDEIKLKCSKCKSLATRIEPVGNPWLDAGIVPFSTLPTSWFPADFITESFPGQFKNWFYSMIAMSTVLKNKPPFKTVLGFASLLAEDGRPMHKSWGNSIEFNEGAGKIGADIMRWTYTRQNPSTNLLFGYKVTDEVRRRFHMLLWNSYRYFANYAALENWEPTKEKKAYTTLDKWILSRFSNTIEEVEKSLDNYDAFHSTRAVESFVQDFSTWYIRRSRDRIGPNAKDEKDKHVCYSVMHQILVSLSQVMAPFTPFLSDRIYTNLTGNESVHLSNWPKIDKKLQSKKLEGEMTTIRKIVEKVHAERKEANIPVRQPLAKIVVSGLEKTLSTSLQKLILDETNIKGVEIKKGKELKVKLDKKLTPTLKAEGKSRDLIREIQKARKVAGTDFDELVEVSLPSWPKEFEEQIKQKALISTLKKGKTLKVIRSK